MEENSTNGETQVEEEMADYPPPYEVMDLHPTKEDSFDDSPVNLDEFEKEIQEIINTEMDRTDTPIPQNNQQEPEKSKTNDQEKPQDQQVQNPHYQTTFEIERNNITAELENYPNDWLVTEVGVRPLTPITDSEHEPKEGTYAHLVKKVFGNCTKCFYPAEIEPSRHNYALIKTQVILPNSNDIKQEPRIVDEFSFKIHQDLADIDTTTLEHSYHGVPDYWNEPEFHRRITREAKERLRKVFPFNIFRDLKVQVMTTPVAIVFKMGGVRKFAVPYNYTQEHKMRLSHPMHAMAHHEEHKDLNRAYDSVFVVVLQCDIDHKHPKRILNTHKLNEGQLETLEFKDAFLKAYQTFTNVKQQKSKALITEKQSATSKRTTKAEINQQLSPATNTGTKQKPSTKQQPNQRKYEYLPTENKPYRPTNHGTPVPTRSIKKSYPHPYFNETNGKYTRHVSNLTGDKSWKTDESYFCPDCKVPHPIGWGHYNPIYRRDPGSWNKYSNPKPKYQHVSERLGYVYTDRDKPNYEDTKSIWNRNLSRV